MMYKTVLFKHDLLFEIKSVLKIVFEDQEGTETYDLLMEKVEELEKKAREKAKIKPDPEEPGEKGKLYIEMKSLQYNYLEILKSCVPVLLQNEEFFKPLLN